MKSFPFFLLALFLSFPVLAQEGVGAGSPPVMKEDAPPVTSAALSADDKERLALAEKMHEIWPIRTRMENAIDAVSQQFPEERRAEVKSAMRKSIQYDQLEEESIKAMATIFSTEELKAMIDFYGSETGRAISAKTPDYEAALTPALTKMMDKAMLDLRTGAKN